LTIMLPRVKDFHNLLTRRPNVSAYKLGELVVSVGGELRSHDCTQLLRTHKQYKKLLPPHLAYMLSPPFVLVQCGK